MVIKVTTPSSDSPNIYAYINAELTGAIFCIAIGKWWQFLRVSDSQPI